MAQLLKRIVVAQKPNILIEDLGPSGVFLRNQGDARDLLSQFLDGKNRFRFTLEQVCNSRSLDNLIKRGHVKLFDENGTELNNAAGGTAERATNLATLKDVDEATGGGGASSFLLLTDTPSSYVGVAGQTIRVNGSEDGLEFSIATATDEKVAIDASATPGYLGSSANDGVLRTSSPLTYLDGGNFIIIGLDQSLIQVTSSQVKDFDESIDDRIAALIQNGTGISWTYVDGSNTLTGNVGGLTVSEFASSNISQWTNDSGFISNLSGFTTSDLSEGTNLYYTDERVDDRISSLLIEGNGISLIYTDASGTLEISVDEAQIDHTNILNIGTYGHAEIDSHIESTSNPHSTSDENLVFSDVTTNNATTLVHGFLPKLSGSSNEFLDGTGNWSTPNNYLNTSFTNQTSVNINHQFGVYPIVQVIVSGNVYIPFSITHNSVNDFTVSFTSSTSGNIIASF